MSSKFIFLETFDRRNYSGVSVIPINRLNELKEYLENIFSIPKLEEFITQFAKLCALVKSWNIQVSEGITIKSSQSGIKTYIIDASKLPSNVAVIAFRQSLWVNPQRGEETQITCELTVITSSKKSSIRRIITMRQKNILSDLILRD